MTLLLFTKCLCKEVGDLAPGGCRFGRIGYEKVLCVRLAFKNEQLGAHAGL